MAEQKIYVIQKHDSSHLHYDLRLEMDGVLKSWALPKEPPLKPHIKRLAVQVEDHDLKHANFEGEIKEGYGKGTVKIWDKGTYELVKQKPGEFVIKIHGKKIKGQYVLLQFEKEKKNWLFFKKKY